jgi:hypothetical protein
MTTFGGVVAITIDVDNVGSFVDADNTVRNRLQQYHGGVLWRDTVVVVTQSFATPDPHGFAVIVFLVRIFLCQSFVEKEEVNVGYTCIPSTKVLVTAAPSL